MDRYIWYCQIILILLCCGNEFRHSHFLGLLDEPHKKDIPLPLEKQHKFDALFELQRSLLQLDSLTAMGLNGKGVTIAIFDAGFKNADQHPALGDLFSQSHILATKDFYAQQEDVFHHSEHGTKVLACLAGKYKGKHLGAAPEANFLLARTEHLRKESPEEEALWWEAARWASSLGADIIITPVTYGSNRYRSQMLDGESTLVSKAAQWAIDQGIIVISSMGNDGPEGGPRAPADVEAVISVGASLPMVEIASPFSSRGPNAKAQLKPDIAANGLVLVPKGKRKFTIESGTSFSAALIGGMTACIRQARPMMSPDEIKEILVQAGHFYPYADYSLGYGVPKAGRIFKKTTHSMDSSFRSRTENDSLFIQFSQLPEKEDKVGYPCYFQFLNKDKQIMSYGSELILRPTLRLSMKLQEESSFVKLWYQGNLIELNLLKN